MTSARAVTGTSAAGEESLRQLQELIIRRTGLAYYTEKGDLLADRIAARISALGLAGPADYLDRLVGSGGESEWQALIDEIIVGESYFFRFAEQFEALKHLSIPECVERRRPERKLRIWSAGCASGAEPYSIAMLIRRELPHLTGGWKVSILGTDISRRQLQRAETGEYNDWDLRQIPDAYRASCFARRGGIWQLRDEFRRGVEFRLQNLVQDGPDFAAANAGSFDIVFCRNVMIYFDPEVNRQLLLTLHRAMCEGGWLFVGHAEPHLEVAEVFQPVPLPGTTLYRKQGDLRARSIPVTLATEALLPAMEHAEPSPPQPRFVETTPPVDATVTFAPAEATGQRQDSEVDEVSRLQEVRRLASRGQWEKAMAICLDLLAQDPLDADVHYLQALILGQTGDSACESVLKKAIYIDRDFALAHYHLGLATAARGDRAAAMRSMRNVLRALRDLGDDQPVRAGDGLTGAQLRKLVELQLRFGEEAR